MSASLGLSRLMHGSMKPLKAKALKLLSGTPAVGGISAPGGMAALGGRRRVQGTSQRALVAGPGYSFTHPASPCPCERRPPGPSPLLCPRAQVQVRSSSKEAKWRGAKEEEAECLSRCRHRAAGALSGLGTYYSYSSRSPGRTPRGIRSSSSRTSATEAAEDDLNLGSPSSTESGSDTESGSSRASGSSRGSPMSNGAPGTTQSAQQGSGKGAALLPRNGATSANGASATHTQQELQQPPEATGVARLSKVPVERIRNFSIIAHIDHGKSTLADKLLEVTETVEKREMKEQFLDNMDLERERGITIKLQAARMRYVAEDGQAYCLNLIDTPGHVDFSYEVSRSLAACEGALLVVDASQGVEAQTLANVYLALDNNLEIIPVLNKIDLPGAEPERVRKEVEDVIGLDTSAAILCSAKEGVGIGAILEAIVHKVPPPKDTTDLPLRCLIFDSYYDQYRGVIVYFRVMDGRLRRGDKVRFMASDKEYEVDEVGVLSPHQMQVGELFAGEVGYLAASIRQVADARVGDTITLAGPKGAQLQLPGYQEAVPMDYCGLFPIEADQFPALREALDKLQLNDAALRFEPESSSAMGFGFRCGFLGLLHMDVVQERLEREYGLNLITTAPSVVYRVVKRDKSEVECSNPSELPDASVRQEIQEPYVKMEILTPKDYIGTLMELAQERRGEFKEMKYVTDSRTTLLYDMPLGEVVGDFFDQLKSRSKGYASMEYSLIGYRKSRLVRLDIQLNGEAVEPLAVIVHEDKAYGVGRALTQRLKELIPRQMFKIPIQACIGTKVIASEAIAAIRKDVLAKCYGGDISRKKKLLKKQAAGKKRMKAVGRVEVPQDAFMAVLRLEKDSI